MLKIEYLENEIPVYDITVADNHNFFANQILVHNCTEILLASTQLGEAYSLLPLCTLAAVNWGKFGKVLTEREEKILRDCCHIIVRGLDALLDYQEYPVEAAERATMLYRPLGVGLIGYAHWLAKGRMFWGTDDALAHTERLMEKQAFYLTEASVELAKEFGSIEAHTRYHEGIFPRDLSKNNPLPAEMPWEKLIPDLKTTGIRNATLSAFMPAETSAQLSNETNGIEPPRDLISIKGSKDGALPQVVPEYGKLNHIYETLWNVKTKDYLKTVGKFQINVDQSISCNSSYDPSRGEITMAELVEDLFFAYKHGIKTMYYCQTNDNANTEHEEDGCAGGACKL